MTHQQVSELPALRTIAGCLIYLTAVEQDMLLISANVRRMVLQLYPTENILLYRPAKRVGTWRGYLRGPGYHQSPAAATGRSCLRISNSSSNGGTTVSIIRRKSLL